MNWRRGIIRIWVLLSVLWVAATATYAINDWNNVRGSEEAVPRHLRLSDVTAGSPAYETKPESMQHSVFVYIVAASAFPLGGAAVGLAVLWIVAGFRSEVK